MGGRVVPSDGRGLKGAGGLLAWGPCQGIPGGLGSWRATEAGKPQEEQKQRAARSPQPAAPACVWEAAAGLGLAAVMLASRARPAHSVTCASCEPRTAEQVHLLLLFRGHQCISDVHGSLLPGGASCS